MIERLPTEFTEWSQRVEQLFADASLTEDNDSNDFCRRFVRQMARAGLLDVFSTSPSVRALCLLRYLIAQKTALGDLLFAMQGLGSYPITLAGNAAQKYRYLTGVGSGDLIAAFAITEPEAGSDPAAMSARAEKTANGYRLNGVKTLISNAGLADFFTIFVRTGEGSRGVTAFILDSNAHGLRIHPLHLIGAHPIGELHLENCELPESARLGNEGEGLRLAYSTLDIFRPTVAAAATGMAERAFREAVSFAKNRKQFGKAISEFQTIQFKIAEMAQYLEASKLLIWNAATKKDEGAARITLESAIAKSFATEAAQQIIDQSLQIHGGIGLIKGSITERLYRDIRALRIYEGTTEILKSVIAQQILKD